MASVTSPGLRLAAAVVVAAAALAWPSPSAAQAYVNPFLGYNFSGDAGCPEIVGCEDKNLNWGFAAGLVGKIVGAELELGFTNGFFGETATTKTDVTTIMGHFLLAPRFGPIQPYGLFGLGLIKSRVEETAGVDETQNDFGYDVGGGVMIFFGKHFGIRGDIRYFRSFDALGFLGDEFQGDNKLDFGRFSGGAVFRF